MTKSCLRHDDICHEHIYLPYGDAPRNTGEGASGDRPRSWPGSVARLRRPPVSTVHRRHLPRSPAMEATDPYRHPAQGREGRYLQRVFYTRRFSSLPTEFRSILLIHLRDGRHFKYMASPFPTSGRKLTACIVLKLC